MKNLRRITGVILAIIVVMAFYAPVALAENGSEEITPPPEETQPSETPSESPSTEPPSETPTQTEPPATPDPTETPTQTPPPEQTPVQTEDAGSVNIGFFVYADGKPAEGYRVKIDNSSLDAKSDGSGTFPGVTVEAHSIEVISKDGDKNKGTLSMGRGDSTGMLSASGGDYSISVSRNAETIYFNILFEAGKPINITSVTNEPVAMESASPSPSGSAQSGTGAFSIVAEYVDSEGETMVGLGVVITPAAGAESLGMSDVSLTNSSGRHTLKNAGFGSYYFGMGEVSAGLENATLLPIEIVQGARTSIVSSADSGYTVETPASTQELYMRFRQVGSSFVLDEVADKAPGAEISSLVVGIIAIVVIVVVVIIVLNVVRKRKKNKNMPQKPGGSGRRGEDMDLDDDEEEIVPRQVESPRSPVNERKTGGNNKFSDRSRF
ncbi:MAG: hypothetical protein ACOYJB_02220 [Christensenellaceae bacterium]